jgi:hypothetical protein
MSEDEQMICRAMILASNTSNIVETAAPGREIRPDVPLT